MDGYVDLIGGAAATVTTLCWLPQARKILRERRADGVSFTSYAAFATGIGLWLAYGLLIGSLPLILANATTLAIVLAILALKLRYP